MKSNFLLTLLWSSTDDKDEPLERNYAIASIDGTDKVDRILEQFEALVEADPVLISIDNIEQVTGNDRDRIAHDLCLTINHHGAGFWGGDYSSDGIIAGEYGDRLTKIAHTFIEIGLYEDNKGRLSIEQY